jgi:hypothetical protein
LENKTNNKNRVQIKNLPPPPPPISLKRKDKKRLNACIQQGQII